MITSQKLEALLQQYLCLETDQLPIIIGATEDQSKAVKSITDYLDSQKIQYQVLEYEMIQARLTEEQLRHVAGLESAVFIDLRSESEAPADKVLNIGGAILSIKR